MPALGLRSSLSCRYRSTTASGWNGQYSWRSMTAAEFCDLSIASSFALTACTADSSNIPRATPDWLLKTMAKYPSDFTRAMASAAPSISWTLAGSPRYPSLTISVLSRSKNTALRFIGPKSLDLSGNRARGEALHKAQFPRRWKDSDSAHLLTVECARRGRHWLEVSHRVCRWFRFRKQVHRRLRNQHPIMKSCLCCRKTISAPTGLR